MLVCEVMSRDFYTCHADDRLVEAAALMKDHNVGFIPVIDSDGFAVGVLTDRDICLAAYRYREPLQTIPVDEVMTAKPVVCSTHTALPHAQRIMAAHRIRRLLVLDKAHRLAGVLSIDDLARAFARGDLRDAETTLRAIAAAADRRMADRSSDPSVDPELEIRA